MIFKKAYINKANEKVVVIQFHEHEIMEIRSALTDHVIDPRSSYQMKKLAIEHIENLKKFHRTAKEKWGDK